MKKIKWNLCMNLVGCERSGEVEVPKNATDEEIHDLVIENLWNELDLYWEEE